MSHDEVWPLFDGWCASQNVEPESLPWDRFLNLVYHFAVRNARKEKKQEFDNAISRAVSQDQRQVMALTRGKALRASVSDRERSGVPQGTQEPESGRNRKLPPRPEGWGDDQTVTRQSLMAAQSLKVGK